MDEPVSLTEPDTALIVLNDCLVCRGRHFYIEPDEDEVLMLMGCYHCGNRVDFPIAHLAGFSLHRWKDPFERRWMYRELWPLYGQWNQSNETFDWRGSMECARQGLVG